MLGKGGACKNAPPNLKGRKGSMANSAFAKDYRKEVVIEGVGKVTIQRLSVLNQEELAKDVGNLKPTTLLDPSIISWDFVDGDGNAVPLTPENVRGISMEISNAIVKEILLFNKITKEEEKNS